MIFTKPILFSDFIIDILIILTELLTNKNVPFRKMSKSSRISDDSQEDIAWTLDRVFAHDSNTKTQAQSYMPTTPKHSTTPTTKHYDIAVLSKNHDDLPLADNVFPIGVQVVSNGSKKFQLTDQLVTGRNYQTIPNDRSDQAGPSSRPKIFSSFGPVEAAGCFDSIDLNDYIDSNIDLINFNSTVAPNKVPITEDSIFFETDN